MPITNRCSTIKENAELKKALRIFSSHTSGTVDHLRINDLLLCLNANSFIFISGAVDQSEPLRSRNQNRAHLAPSIQYRQLGTLLRRLADSRETCSLHAGQIPLNSTSCCDASFFKTKIPTCNLSLFLTPVDSFYNQIRSDHRSFKPKSNKSIPWPGSTTGTVLVGRVGSLPFVDRLDRLLRYLGGVGEDRGDPTQQGERREHS